jgi:peptidoglycan/xylan/chitin deacetylase (PgdA/CDA1 family)
MADKQTILNNLLTSLERLSLHYSTLELNGLNPADRQTVLNDIGTIQTKLEQIIGTSDSITSSELKALRDEYQALLDNAGTGGTSTNITVENPYDDTSILTSINLINDLYSNTIKNISLKKQSDYIKNIRKFKDLSGVTKVTDTSGLFTFSSTSDNSLKISSNNSTTIGKFLIDLSNYGEGFSIGELKNMGLKIKVTGWDKLSYINVNLWATSSPTQGYNNSLIQAPAKIFADGIYYVPLLDKDFSVYVGNPLALSMNFLRLEILPLATNSAGTSLEIEIMDIVKFKSKKSKCMISFDDGHSSCIEIADLLEARNLRGTFYIYNQGIGQSGNLTLSQLQDLHTRGHDIAVHNNVHDNLTTLGEDIYFAGQQECRNWIRENIGSRSENHAAFVGGISTQSLIERMEKANFKSLRRATPSAQFVHSGWGCEIENKFFNSRFRGNVYEMNNTQTVQVIKDAHQNAINYNQDFFVYGHQLKEIETAQSWSNVVGSAYSMPDYFDWIKSKVDDGSIEVLTVSQFWSEYED